MKQLSLGKQTLKLARAIGARLTLAGSSVLATLALGPSVAQAHPGHALGDHGAMHVVTSPYHLAILAGVGLTVWMSARFVQQRVPRRLMQIGGLAAVAVAGLLWGFGV